jgi:transcriptional regulator GlxA family with amidase domain
MAVSRSKIEKARSAISTSMPPLGFAGKNLGCHKLCPELVWQEALPRNSLLNSLYFELRAPETYVSLASVNLRLVQDFAKRGFLRPMGDVLPQKMLKEYHKPLLDHCTYQGKLHAIPEDVSPYVLISRRDVLAEHSLPPPKTWGELEEQAKFLSEKRKGPVIGISQKTPHQLLSFFLALLASNGVEPPQNAEDLLKHQKLYGQLYDWIQNLTVKNNLMEIQPFSHSRFYTPPDLFNADKWVYRFCWLIDLRRESQEFFKKIHIDVFPRGPSGNEPLTLGRGHVWIIPEHSRTISVGMGALRRLTSIQTILKQEAKGGFPFHARASIWKKDVIRKRHPLYKQAELLLPKNRRYVPDNESEFLRRLFQLGLIRSLRRGETAQKWLSRVTKDVHIIVKQALSYMEKNAANGVTIEQVCEHLQKSRQHLDRLFKQDMRVSTANYLEKLRMEIAYEFIAKTNLSVKEVAIRTGFTDPNVFSRTFRRYWDCTASTIAKDVHKIMKEAVMFIEENAAKGVTIEQICKALQKSRRNLDRLFENEIHISIADHLKNLKMAHALSLLQKSDLSVKEVAAQTGFSNPIVFGRLFQKHWGYSPGAIQRKSSRETRR